MATAKRAKKSKKSKGRKKPRSAAQKAATKRMLAANKKCAPKRGRKAKKGKAKRKGGRKARRSPAQKAATKQMLAANKKSHPKKGRKAARKGARKGKRRAAAKHDGALGTRVSHLEKVQNADHKTIAKHTHQLSTLGSTERKMKQILGAKGLSAKAALAPKAKKQIGLLVKLETKKAVAKAKSSMEAANAAKYG